jgi:hypothetical protein
MEAIAQTNSNQKQLALIGLLLVALAPTVSVITSFMLKTGVVGALVFVFTKIWMFGLPAYWYLKVEGGERSYSLPQSGGWMVSTLLGLGTIGVIGVAYFLLGDQVLRSEDLYKILDPYGLTIPWKLALGIVFWIFINSVLEEYVFRWFITSKLEQLVGGKWIPILLSAGIFTLHHTIALAFFIDPLGNALASLGVFLGGVIFSWLYVQYRSIWVAWVAHALADVAVFAIAWHLIVGF